MSDEALRHLRKFVAEQSWQYQATGPNATEPAAFACLALCAHGLHDEATPLADWLAGLQTAHGSVGVTEDHPTPAWPTSLALLAWLACDDAHQSNEYDKHSQLALEWTLKTHGKTAPNNVQVGHDTTLAGWSWAEATHSWLEPTCLFVLALKAMGQSEHARTREGVRIIIDRQLESGGCNYGNTQVLGQATLAHIQPTGLAMLAIADEPRDDPRIGKSLDYLEHAIAPDTATASLCFSLLGLTAHHRRPINSETLLDNALARDESHGSLSCYKLALLSLATAKDLSWLPQPELPHTLNALKT